MSANITINPVKTVVAAGTFNIQTDGYIVGFAMPDPATRFQLAGGLVAANETMPMWGGVGISESVANPTYSSSRAAAALGGSISRATQLGSGSVAGSLTGFTVYDQNYSMINSPQSPAPQSAPGMMANFYRFGSNARIPLALNTALSLSGNLITQPVSWDFVNQEVSPYAPAWAETALVSATYDSTTGHFVVTFGSAPLGSSPTVGTYLQFSGVAGTGNAAELNGNWPILSSGSGGDVITVQAPTGLGSITVTGATGQIAAGGGALPIKVLDFNIGNSLVPVYDPVTGFTTWNYNGSAVLCQI